MFFTQTLDRLGWWFHKGSDGKFSRRYWFHRMDTHTPHDRTKLRIDQVNLDFYWFRKKFDWSFVIGMEHDCEGTFSLRLAIPYLLTFYASANADFYDWVKKITGEYEGRWWGFSVDGTRAQLQWRASKNGWGPDTREFGHNWYYPWDSLKGKPVYRDQVLETQVRTFTQPAFKNRPASDHEMTLRRIARSWHYRNPFVKDVSRTSWDVSFKDGQQPPRFAGKGENSYDCGDDGIWGTGFEAMSADDTVQQYIAKVTEQRERYG